ncbi:GNAT family N-acetyltransferase [Erythrobacter mangrovi]|uniref:GNAT family N-acetyltransferase n=1 Tax=Erythrobacter mangrovi TaxID=2739433 RepID=A0A7D4C4Q7_9SPHN|nr:GNAT family N-acetyltransferase [Erythrobacter mangrovi]QKG71505.1 GNAT family N-acetyltransferase [Erythrobacter mangrovi]
MAYSIRPFRDDDAEVLPLVWREAIVRVGALKYSPEQVTAWLRWQATPEKFRSRVADGAIILVAVDADDRPVAYALLEQDGHLDHLYNHPGHTRQGLAARLLGEAEALARSWGVTRLYSEASDLARPAFERAGYVMMHKREFEIDGVQIHNWAMEKPL